MAMPDPIRTADKSAAIFRRFGANLRQSYEAVMDIAGELATDMHESGDGDESWLTEIWQYAYLRVKGLPADETTAPGPPAGESASNAGSPQSP